MAVVSECTSDNPIYVSAGYGCHPSRQIALTRAVCEALQSRLSFIHGGRDDLTERYERFAGWSRQARRNYAERLVTELSRNGKSIQFRKIRDYSKVATNLESALKLLLSALDRNGFKHVLRVIYTPENFPLQVVRILVPGLECFNQATTRIGLRLRDYVRDEL
jgi:ribosomal protein S12 methylthiotransferase accessory factor